MLSTDMALLAFSTTLSKKEEDNLKNGTWLRPYFTLKTENIFFFFFCLKQSD